MTQKTTPPPHSMVSQNAFAARPLASHLAYAGDNQLTSAPNQLAAILESYDALFRAEETRRDSSFENVLQDYANRSKEAERERSLAASIRDNVFQSAEHRFQTQFDESCAMFSSRFQSREAFRDHGDDHRYRQRSTIFKFSQAALKLLQNSFNSRLTSLVDMEDGFTSDFKPRTLKIHNEMGKVIHLTRQSLNDMFVEYLRGFGYNVNIAPIPKFVPLTVPDYPRCTIPVPSLSFGGDGEPGSDKAPQGKVPKPERLFVSHLSSCKDLFNMILNIQGLRALGKGWDNELPLPPRREQSVARVHSSISIEACLQAHEADFVASEARRQQLASDTFETWQRIFAVEEYKRQREFQSQRSKHAEEARERDINHTCSFSRSQADREGSFQKNEVKREENFDNMDREGPPFEGEEDLHLARLKGLQRAQRIESEREDAFTTWRLDLEARFWRKMIVWRNDFLSDERKRQQIFQELVGHESSDPSESVSRSLLGDCIVS